MRYQVRAISVNVARAVYALNWFDITPGLIFISQDLDLKLVYLGVATTAFYIGLAALQMVGGILATKYGSRIISFLGILTLGLGGILSGFSTNLLQLALFRFITGSGAAMFFSPGLSLLKSVTPQEKYGHWVGIYNGSFNLGGGVGAFGWVFVDDVLGWRMGLVLGGILAIASGIIMFLLTGNYGNDRLHSSKILTETVFILKNKYLWLLSVGLMSGMFSETIIGQFIIFYSETYVKIGETLAGTLGGIFLILGFPGGVIGGYIFSRMHDKKKYSYVLSFIVSLLLVPIALSHNVIILFSAVILEGFLTVNTFSILYTLTTDFIRERESLPFALSFVNFVQIAFGSMFPTIFTAIASIYSYRISWLALSIMGILLTGLIKPVKISDRK